MIPEDDSRHSIEFKDHYVIQPDFTWWNKKSHLIGKGGNVCPDGFSYKSDTNNEWLSVDDIKGLVKDFQAAHPEYR
jgi:UDP-N-acetylglucosamine 4,6-dehydratase